MQELVERLNPSCRSTAGDGIRATLDAVAESIPLAVHEVSSGTQVLDWTVPKDRKIRNACVPDPDGRVIDFATPNLHVTGYSVPVRTKITLAELRRHMYTVGRSRKSVGALAIDSAAHATLNSDVRGLSNVDLWIDA
jgi:aminopeptidase-like protein